MTSADEKNEAPQNRREFLGRCMHTLVGITIAGVVAPTLPGCEFAETFGGSQPAGEEITVDVSALDADGKSLKTVTNAPDGSRVLVIRESATTYIALSSRCTHEGCGVDRPVDGIIVCQCHGAEYNIDGSNRTGPAVIPLTRFATTFDESTQTLTVKF